jgi:hypothetical protein
MDQFLDQAVDSSLKSTNSEFIANFDPSKNYSDRLLVQGKRSNC